MSSYEEQNNDNFKLVSLDGSTPKSGAQQAKRAYSSYLKDDEYESDSNSTMQITETDPTVSEPVVAPPPPKPTNNKVVNKQNKGTKSLGVGTQNLSSTSTTPLKNKNGKSYQTSDDVDLFDGEQTAEEVSERLGELKNSVSTLFINFKNTLVAASLKGASKLMKPIGMVAGIAAKAANIPLKLITNVISSLSNKMGQSAKALGAKDADQIRQEEQEQEQVQVEIKTSNFNEMIELNIFFTDNYKKALYNKPKNAGFKLSKMEEELICGMAIEAIRECAEFTAELPPPASGIYEGRSISEVMDNITNEDIAIFLGFVKGFPGKYIGKTWKISETFATWLINNSPLG